MIDTLTTIFVEADDFCKQNVEKIKERLKKDFKKNLNRKHKMTVSEVATIVIIFPFTPFKYFKPFFEYISKKHKSEFPNICSYTNFIEFKNKIGFVLEDFNNFNAAKIVEKISIIDSFSIKVCHNERRHMYKVLRPISANGKGTMGFFTGVKLLIGLCPLSRYIMSFHIMPGNKADNDINELIPFIQKSNAEDNYGDRGFLLSEQNKQKLQSIGKKIITKNRSNMKAAQLTEKDHAILDQRNLIESVGNILKNKLGIEHTRHRSIFGFFTSVFATLASYYFYQKNPKLTIQFE